MQLRYIPYFAVHRRHITTFIYRNIGLYLHHKKKKKKANQQQSTNETASTGVRFWKNKERKLKVQYVNGKRELLDKDRLKSQFI